MPAGGARHKNNVKLAPVQAQGELAGLSPEKAARRGRTLLNLRCVDVEGGLLGRSLLTLVNNKAGAPVLNMIHCRCRPANGPVPPVAELSNSTHAGSVSLASTSVVRQHGLLSLCWRFAFVVLLTPSPFAPVLA